VVQLPELELVAVSVYCLTLICKQNVFKDLNMGHFARNTPYISWVKVLFLGELKGPGDSTGLE